MALIPANHSRTLAHRKRDQNPPIRDAHNARPGRCRHIAQTAKTMALISAIVRVALPAAPTIAAQNSFQRTMRQFHLGQTKIVSPKKPRARVKHTGGRIFKRLPKGNPAQYFLHLQNFFPCSQGHHLRQKTRRRCQGNFSRLPPKKFPRDSCQMILFFAHPRLLLFLVHDFSVNDRAFFFGAAFAGLAGTAGLRACSAAGRATFGLGRFGSRAIHLGGRALPDFI